MKDAVDYKKKYLDLRAQMVTSMDMAFRMGYQRGQFDAQQQQMIQQQQQQAAIEAQINAQAGAAPGQEGAPADQGGAPAPDQGAPADQGMQPAEPQGEELDQYVSELENLVNKGEISADDLKKSIEKIKNFQSNVKLTKSLRNMKPFKLNPRAAANLTANDKKNLTMQEQVIDNIMKKWESEAPKTTSQAMQALGVEALTKGE
jgi:hypothetical protein